MRVVHALEPLQKSIFLVGPTPRDSATPSWRPRALEILRRLGFDGTVFVPESADWQSHDSYEAQVRWEWEALDQATVVACWVPRDLGTMPAFTTNVEIGMVFPTGRAFLGCPRDAPKTSYLRVLAARFAVPVCDDLEALMALAAARADELAEATLRAGG